MEINATYAYTRQRDPHVGKTSFCVIAQNLPMDHGSPILECIGTIPPFYPGMPVVLTGRMEESCFVVETASLDCRTHHGIIGLLGYLSVTHLNGELTASQIEEIAEACHEDILAFCSTDECLPMLYDICKQTENHERMAHDLVLLIRDLAHHQEFFTVLQRYAIPYGHIEAMLQKGITIDRLRENPYLVMANFDVPLSAAEAFTRHECDMTDYAKPRCLGYVYAAIRYLMDIGHTCFTLSQLSETVNKRYAHFLGSTCFSPALINACITDLDDICRYHIIDSKTYIFPNSTWNAEVTSAHHIHRLQKSRKNFNISITAEDTAEEIGINYNKDQRTVFDLLHTSGVKILTAPPGTGKTAVINGLIRNFEINGNGIVRLAAATGSAAKWLEAATNRETDTVHAMLRMTAKNGMICGRDLSNPVDADLIIVDEFSVMGIQQFSALAGAVKSGAVLLLVGDEHQLPSIECGNVLHDLIASGEIPVYKLTEIFQQAGTIQTNAAKVNNGNAQLDEDDRFVIKTVSDGSMQQMLTDDYNPLTSQIITPLKNGPAGTSTLNRMIQEHVNCNSPVVASCGAAVFRRGDKVIMTKNNYESGYIKGDIGYIRKQHKNGDLQIEFAKGSICISQKDFGDMELAYAITIRKSQGSKFLRVHIVLPKGDRNLTTRRQLYTAITRAQEEVIIYNQDAALQDAIADRTEKSRLTMLSRQITVKKERW